MLFLAQELEELSYLNRINQWHNYASRETKEEREKEMRLVPLVMSLQGGESRTFMEMPYVKVLVTFSQASCASKQFPTCQVRVVRFYKSSSRLLLRHRLLVANSSLPALHRVGSAGPEPPERMPERLSKNMSECQKYIPKKCRQICQIECQKGNVQ